MSNSLMLQRTGALQKAKAIVASAKAEDRDLTSEELATVNTSVAEVKALDSRIANQPPGILAELGRIDAAADGTAGSYLALGSKAFTAAVVIGMTGTERQTGGSKALAPSGQTTVDLPLVDHTPTTLGRPVNSLLEVLPVVVRAPHYSILRQVTRTNNAAVVATGALKPTSILGVAKEDNRLRVVATLSEPIDKYVLQDNGNLSTWISTELAGGVRDALEAQVLNGNGTGENFRGLNSTNGIQMVSAATADKLVTLRQAITAVETASYIPSVFVVNANDWSGIESQRNQSGGFDLGGPIDAATRLAWGVPVAVSTQVPAGTAWLLSEGSTVLGIDRAGLVTEWGTPGDAFSRNQIVARTEGRFSLDVIAPQAVAKIALIPAA